MLHHLHRKLPLLVCNDDSLSPASGAISRGGATLHQQPRSSGSLGVIIYACPLKLLSVVDTVLLLPLTPTSSLKCSLLGWEQVDIMLILAQRRVNTYLSPCYLKQSISIRNIILFSICISFVSGLYFILNTEHANLSARSQITLSAKCFLTVVVLSHSSCGEIACHVFSLCSRNSQYFRGGYIHMLMLVWIRCLHFHLL